MKRPRRMVYCHCEFALRCACVRACCLHGCGWMLAVWVSLPCPSLCAVYALRHCKSMFDIPEHIAAEIVFRLLNKGVGRALALSALCRPRRPSLFLRQPRAHTHPDRPRRPRTYPFPRTFNSPVPRVHSTRTLRPARRPTDAANSSQNADLQLRGNNRVCCVVSREPKFCPDRCWPAHCQGHTRRLPPLSIPCRGAQGLAEQMAAKSGCNKIRH